MSDTLIHVTTQYYENYGTEIHGVSHDNWKPKGSFIFSLMVDFDYLMYGENEVIEAIKLLVAEESTPREKFEYVSHEIIFNEIIKLDPEKFEAAFTKVIDHLTTSNNFNQ